MYIGMNYVNGDWCPTRPDFTKYNPSTLCALGSFPLSSESEIKEAVASARYAQKKWRDIGRVQRAEYFDKLCQLIKRDHDKIVKVISEETGKNLNESHAEVIEALHMAQYTFGKSRMPSGDVIASELPERDSYVIKKPKGIVAIISPWNFPFAIGGFWCAAPALLEGNTVVFKPSELSPMTGQLITQLYHEAGFPPGVFNLVHGDGFTGSNLVNSDVNHICFTGSVQVGQTIRSACANSRDKTCSCEMGSKSAVIVFDDCDIDLAVQASLNSALKLTGQRCVSASRIIVQRNILHLFKQKFIAALSEVKLDDPFLSHFQNFSGLIIGPLISNEQKERVMHYAQMIAQDSDVQILHNNSSIPKKGYYFGPLVYQCEWANKNYLKEEIFGPVVGVIPFDTVEDAIRIYNDTDYGLAVGICTNDYRVMRKMRDNCDAGMIYFNLGSIGAESHLPFSGVKMSAYGYGSAAATFDAVVHQVSVTYNHAQGVTFPQGLK
jgi:aldehyde dehydrogenase (NAD+)